MVHDWFIDQENAHLCLPLQSVGETVNCELSLVHSYMQLYQTEAVYLC